jgi:CPA2 family monovalent cation:H+ antiporter-2
MENILVVIFISLTLATLLNITLKKFGISHIIGYIFSGTIVSYIFNFNGLSLHSLELIGEFGIVFLMFTIGLELNLEKIKKMKETLLANGLMQVVFSSLLIFSIAYFIFSIEFNTSLIVSLAFSLSSTAIVLPYLKESKDIHTPYGQKTMSILIFQDLAVIPILLLITFLTNDTVSIVEVLLKTIISAVIVVFFMFFVAKYIFKKVLKYAANTSLEELFLGSVFAIVLGSSLLAHNLGFTYSLGAFIAGMIIADTGYNIKVEADIASYKDLLLGAFFFSVGTKIDAIYFLTNLHIVFLIFSLVFISKALMIYMIIKRKSDTNTSAKTAIALASVGEFSFAIFALAFQNKLISYEITSFLILITVISMILTPFLVNNIYKLSSYFQKEFYESDVITPIQTKDHIVIAGFSTLGRVIAQNLKDKDVNFIIVSDNLKHVLLARKLGFLAYFAHLNKIQVLESLNVDKAKAIVITTSNTHKKHLISQAVLNYHKAANIILRIDTLDERKELRDLHLKNFIDANMYLGELIASKAININQKEQ